MRLPIDTNRLQFLVVAAAEPLKQYEEGKPHESWAARTDVNGEVLWRVSSSRSSTGRRRSSVSRCPAEREPG
jgi:hypothetical protein